MYERVKDSADSMMMAIVVEIEECTSLTVISCLSAVQASTPSGSQPLPLRARHLPLPQRTAFMMTALSARHFVLSSCAREASVSGAQGKAMRLSDIKQIIDTKKERPLIRALFFIISKIHTARLYPQAWDPWGFRGGRRRPSRTAQGRVYPRALLCL